MKTLLLASLLLATAARAEDPWYVTTCQQVDGRVNTIPGGITFRAVVMVHPAPKAQRFTVYTTPDGKTLDNVYSGKPLNFSRKEGQSTVWSTKSWDEMLMLGGHDNIMELMVVYSVGGINMKCVKNWEAR